MNIFVSIPLGENRDTFLTEENVAFLESLGTLTWNNTEEFLDAEKMRDALENVDILVCGWGTPKLTEEVLSKANRLKLVAYVAGSVANVVSEAMYNRGIRIVCGNEAFARSVAEASLAYMLCALRDIPYYNNRMQKGLWKAEVSHGRALNDQTVGIIGYGAISKYLLDLLRPFNVKILLYSGHMTQEQAESLGVQKASLEEIFSTCKVVSVHSARSAKNYHMINEQLLRMMKEDAVLVNTARGDIIDEEALIRVAREGKIRAILDVFEEEPLPLNSGLRGMENVILLPHCGGPTIDKRCDAARLVLDDILRLQRNEPLQNEIVAARAATMSNT